MKLRQKIRLWPKGRQRVASALLLMPLLVCAFYGVENLRGHLALDAAWKAAAAEGLPGKVSGIDSPPVPASRNLFLSHAVRNRVLMEGGFQAPWGNQAPVRIPWGNFRPRTVKPHRMPGRSVDTSAAAGRRMDFSAVRDAMAGLGWTLPPTESPAEAVLGGLGRFQFELNEWAGEIRARPEWSITESYAPYAAVFEKLLTETIEVFGLRAVAAASAGRPEDEILEDLESVSRLCRHSAQSSGAVNGLVWELLQTRRLSDEQLLRVSALLLEEPVTATLLKSIQTHDLADRSAEPEFKPWWGDERNLGGRILEKLQPRGWFQLAEAWEVRAGTASKHWLDQTSAAWRAGKALPDRPGAARPAWWALGGPFTGELHFSRARHLLSCGCEWSSVVEAALESRLAMVGIGLERYRMRYDEWPKTLEEARDLVPGGLRLNPVTGKPFIYHVLPEGGWVLEDGGRWKTWRTAVTL